MGGGGGVEGGVVMDRCGEGRSFCEASVFNKERIRHGQNLSSVCTRVLWNSTSLFTVLHHTEWEQLAFTYTDTYQVQIYILTPVPNHSFQ